MDEIEQIVDITGETRRLGSLCPDTGMLQAFTKAPMAIQEYTDAEIRELISDPNYRSGRHVFGKHWISNQGSFGSCNGWATSGVLSRSRWLRGIRDGMVLSGSYLYSWMNGNRDQGSNLSDGLKVVEKHGAPSQVLVPPSKIYRSQIPSSVDTEAAKHKGLKAYPVRTIQGLKTALARMMPCVVAVHAGGNFQRLNASGIAGVDNGRGNHAVLCDGIKFDGQWLFDHANSWGLNYGQEGRSWLTEGSFAQTFGVHTFWALASTEEAD